MSAEEKGSRPLVLARSPSAPAPPAGNPKEEQAMAAAAVDGDGCTALHVAAAQGDLAAVRAEVRTRKLRSPLQTSTRVVAQLP